MSTIRLPVNTESVAAFHRSKLNQHALGLQFTLESPVVKNSCVEIEMHDGHKAKHIVQVLDNKTKICSCNDFSVNHLGYCGHIAAIDNVLHHTDSVIESGNIQNFHDTLTCQNWIKQYNQALNRLQKKPEVDLLYFDPIRNATIRRKGHDCSQEHVLLSETTRRNLTNKSANQFNPLDVDRSNFDDLLKGITFWDYQKDVLEDMLTAQRAVCAMDVGSGKTLTTIGAMQYVYNERGDISVLVVSPKSLKIQWKAEIDRVSDSFATFDVSSSSRLNSFLKYPGSKVGIVTYQFMSRNADALKRHNFDMVVADEIQIVRNHESKVWKNIKKLKSEFCYGLSGTIIENKIDDLYNIMEVIDPGLLSPRWKFEADYKVVDSINRTKIIYSGTQNIKHLQQRTKHRVFTYFNKTLPPIKYHFMKYPMETDQRSNHDHYLFEAKKLMAKSMNADLTFGEKAMVQAFLLKARQSCNTTELIDGQPQSSPKIDGLMKLIKEKCINQNKKVVVFSEWVKMIDICLRYMGNDIKYIKYTGQLSPKQRHQVMNQFVHDDDTKLFIASDAGGVGLDGLQLVSHDVVHTELPWNPAKLDQRNGRVHRQLQKEEVNVHYLVSKSSIEEDMIDKLSNKKRIRLEALI